MTTPDRSITRRDALTMAAVCMSGFPIVGCSGDTTNATGHSEDLPRPVENKAEGDTTLEGTMRVHYLEIVTQDVDALCELHSAVHGVTFGDGDQALGGARTAKMPDGGMMGIRAPMHDAEKSVTRAYMLVEDIEAAVAAVTESGAKIAVPPMEIPGHGTCAIFMRGGIEAGFWQL